MEWLESFSLMPLKELALRRVATKIWSRPVMYRFVAQFNLVERSEQKQEKILEKLPFSLVSVLPLPASTKKELFTLMEPVCREITKWLNFHEKFLEMEDPILHEQKNLELLRWTSYGTVDYQKTAKALVRQESIGIADRYKLACLYCFDVEIRDLWKQLSARTKRRFYNFTSPLRVHEPEIVAFWTCIAKGQENKLDCFLSRDERNLSSVFQYAFESVAVQGYASATQYFYGKLTSDEKEASLVRTAQAVANERCTDYYCYIHEYHKHSDVLCYLFSLMRTEQLNAVLETNSCEALKCLMDWPRQDAFAELAKLSFPYLTEADYSRLIFILSGGVPSELHFPKLFRNLFIVAPKDFRSYTLSRYGYFLGEFFRSKDVETLRFFIRNLNVEERVELVFSVTGLFNCFELVKDGNWDMVELFIREATLPREEKRKLTSKFDSFFERLLERKERQRFIKLVNKIDSHTLKSDKCPPPSMDVFKKHPAKELIEKPAKRLKKR